MPTINAEVEIEVEVWCETCGAGLCRQSSANNTDISVEVCDKCQETARSEGYDKGYDEGYDRGCKDTENEILKQME